MYKYNNVRKVICISLLISLLICPISIHAIDISDAKAAILIDQKSKCVLYERNADTKLPMASTTKIMTALTALCYASEDKVITVPKCAVGTEGTSASLIEGEPLTLKELLYALLLQSANDAAVTIAVGIAGSVEGFAVLMNSKAREIGLCSTHYDNPHGLPSETHYTTARDLAISTAYALENETISSIVASKKATIPYGDSGHRYLTNHNKMLSIYEGADGVKTGFTKASGRCLVSSATRDSMKLIAVTLNSKNDWAEHTKMLDYGFENFKTYSSKDISLTSLILPSADGKYVFLEADERYFTLKKDEDVGMIKAKYEYPRFIFSYPKKRVLGKIKYYKNCTLIAQSLLHVKENTIQSPK